MVIMRKAILWLLFALVVSCSSRSSFKLLRKDVHGKLGAPPSSLLNTPIPPDQWFIQTLDHFDPTNNSTWRQRYQVGTDYFTKNGPVFLQIGGEGEISPLWMVNGAWVDYAKKYKALLFQLEHRFYGESHPTSDMSVENLRYLSSEQALADLAAFIVAMNEAYKLPEGTKWIAFGGSYPGNLAAWLRYKYPHLVHGAMSASGPVLAQLDFPEYMEVVGDSLSTYSSKCVESVQTADNHLNLLLKHPIGQKTVNKEFSLCEPIDSNNANDVANLLETLAGNFADIVQYNKDNRISGRPKWNVTIDTLCDIMVDESRGTPIIRYAEVNSLFLDHLEQECLDYKYDNMIGQLRNTSWDLSNGGRQWVYQTCTEFGYFQTAENSKRLFGNDFPVEFFTQQCSDIFGKEFNAKRIAKGVARTNTIYGGLNIKATRVVYVHGSIDPWHALGITKTRLPESPAIYITGTAHCANMYPATDTDLPALRAARKEISTLIGKWLAQK